MSANKPVVLYKDAADWAIQIGAGCYLQPINHYSALVSNTKWVRTSPVVAFNAETGEIETMNTIYKKPQ